MKILGFECKLFRGPAGSTPSSEVKEVTSVNLTLDKTQVDITSRSSGGWKQYRGGLKDVGVELSIFHDNTDEDYLAFRDSFINGTPLAIFVADDSGCGIDGDFEVFSFSEPQETDDGVKVSITLKPTRQGVEGRIPAWIDAKGE